MKRLVKDCLLPEALTPLGAYGVEFAEMTVEEFVAAFRKHHALPNFDGPEGAALEDSPTVFAKHSAFVAAAGAMGLPTDENNLFTVPGPDWICRKDQEAAQATEE